MQITRVCVLFFVNSFLFGRDDSGTLGYEELRDGLRRLETTPPLYMSLEDFGEPMKIFIESKC